MYLRDLSVFLLLAVLVVATVRRPIFGVLGWVLFGVMNPHRLTWGPAFDFQFSMVIAIVTLVSLLFSRTPKEWKGGLPSALLLILLIWCIINTIFAFSVPRSFEYLDRVAKTFLMVGIMLLIMNSRQHIHWLLATLVFSLGFYGVKGGIFVLGTGGNYAVNGPYGSMVAGNNELAVGLVMTIPIMFYFYQQASRKLVRWALLAAMALCTMSVIGSYSRGALLAVIGMGFLLWLRSAKKVPVALGLLVMLFVAIPFMPDHWTARMNTIKTHEEDASASNRLIAWETAYNLAKDRFPLGGGFEYEMRSVSEKYSPVPGLVMVPHSIYFQTLGTQGFLGLGIWLLFWALVWRQCAWLRRHCRSPSLAWASQFASMAQVSLMGYFIGGAFLNLAFWDVPYYLFGAIAVTVFVARRELAVQATGPKTADRTATTPPLTKADAVSPGTG